MAGFGREAERHMSSAVSESATWETSVIGPDGADVINVTGIRNGLQDLAKKPKTDPRR